MFFSRKKKQLRDAEAGLTFNWRGGRNYQFDKILAFIITIAVLAFAIYAVKVDEVVPAMVSKRNAKVSMIDAEDMDSRKLMSLIDERSPFPPRWDPAYDLDVLSRIKQGVRKVIAKKSIYKGELRLLPEEVDENRMTFQELGSGLMVGGEQSSSQWYVAPEAEVENPIEVSDHSAEIGVYLNVSSGLERYLANDFYTLPKKGIPDDEYGQSFEFVVGVDKSGKVINCFPLIGGSANAQRPLEIHKALATWLKTKFSGNNIKVAHTAKGGLVVGQVELYISAKR